MNELSPDGELAAVMCFWAPRVRGGEPRALGGERFRGSRLAKPSAVRIPDTLSGDERPILTQAERRLRIEEIEE